VNSYLLHIETSTKNCSVALSLNGKLINCNEFSGKDYSHGEKLHVFINKTIVDSNIAFSDLSGISVSKGPGSYTGLRIGVAAAKGLCYALNIPLLSVNSLSVLAQQMSVDKDTFLAPMFDARRMEVYTQILDYKHQVVKPTWSEVLTPESFNEHLSKSKIVAFGVGSKKTKGMINHPNFELINKLVEPSARDMILLSHKKWEDKILEDLAYFEPFYLKEFFNTKN
tara:strand:- start:5250 stop:5924 length:675 start_codon:yes stop_codon:yes gene_type:complete